VFFTPPTAIDYREPNVSATMQQPSSVVHGKLQYTQPLNTQRKHRKKQVFSSFLAGNCYMHYSFCCTSTIPVLTTDVQILC